MTTSDPNLSEPQGATRDELAPLAPSLNLEILSDQITGDLNAAILNYRDSKGDEEQAAGSNRLGPGLARLKERAIALNEAVADLRPSDLEKLTAADLPGTEGLAEVLKNMPSLLSRMVTASEQAVQADRRAPGGNTSDNAPLRKLILSLMVIFERETGKEAGNSWDPRKDVYFGPFFDLVKGVIEIADPDAVFSNSALGSQITRALMKAKELSREYFARILARSTRHKDSAENSPA